MEHQFSSVYERSVWCFGSRISLQLGTSFFFFFVNYELTNFSIQINFYIEELTLTAVPNQNLALLEFNFLRIITDYEHFIPLNLPLLSSLNNPKFELLSFWYVLEPFFFLTFPESDHTLHRERHYLIGLLLNEINTTFFKFTKKEHSRIRFVAVNVLYNLILKHDLDPRYQDAGKKERIAALYFPFILSVSFSKEDSH